MLRLIKFLDGLTELEENHKNLPSRTEEGIEFILMITTDCLMTFMSSSLLSLLLLFSKTDNSEKGNEKKHNFAETFYGFEGIVSYCCSAACHCHSLSLIDSIRFCLLVVESSKRSEKASKRTARLTKSKTSQQLCCQQKQKRNEMNLICRQSSLSSLSRRLGRGRSEPISLLIAQPKPQGVTSCLLLLRCECA